MFILHLSLHFLCYIQQRGKTTTLIYKNITFLFKRHEIVAWRESDCYSWHQVGADIFIFTPCCDRSIFRAPLCTFLTELIRATFQCESVAPSASAQEGFCSDCSLLLTDHQSFRGWNYHYYIFPGYLDIFFWLIDGIPFHCPLFTSCWQNL